MTFCNSSFYRIIPIKNAAKEQITPSRMQAAHTEERSSSTLFCDFCGGGAGAASGGSSALSPCASGTGGCSASLALRNSFSLCPLAAACAGSAIRSAHAAAAAKRFVKLIPYASSSTYTLKFPDTGSQMPQRSARTTMTSGPIRTIYSPSGRVCIPFFQFRSPEAVSPQ